MHSLFAPLFSSDAIVFERGVELVDDRLFPEELACVRNAVEARRAQFGSGRLCARQALAQLGFEERPLTVAQGGSPAWPSGAVGSITHTSTYCAAVVKPCPPWRGVGLDAENVRALDADIVRAITTDTERLWLSGLAHEDRAQAGVLVFSAKEAYYKLQYPLTRRFLDFADVEIAASPTSGTFRVQARTETLPELALVEGRFTIANGMVLCGIELA
jgi:4'-phosphopantetheinyl transferase EntD